MGSERCLPLLTRMVGSLYAFPRPAGRVPSHHRISFHRVQMQSGLLVLLGLRQQSQRHDRRRGPSFHRLAARQWMPSTRVNGRRAAPAAGFRAQSRLLRCKKRILGLYRHQWPLASARRGGSSWRRRRLRLQLCHGFMGPQTQPAQGFCPSAEKSRAYPAQAIRGRLPGLLQHQYLPQ